MKKSVRVPWKLAKLLYAVARTVCSAPPVPAKEPVPAEMLSVNSKMSDTGVITGPPVDSYVVDSGPEALPLSVPTPVVMVKVPEKLDASESKHPPTLRATVPTAGFPG